MQGSHFRDLSVITPWAIPGTLPIGHRANIVLTACSFRDPRSLLTAWLGGNRRGKKDYLGVKETNDGGSGVT